MMRLSGSVKFFCASGSELFGGRGGGPAGSRGLGCRCSWPALRPWPPSAASASASNSAFAAASSRRASSCRRPDLGSSSPLCRGRRRLLLGVRSLGCAQPLARPRPRAPPHASPTALAAHRLALEAFALILVPSSATWPSFTSPPVRTARDSPEQLQKAPSSAACGSRRRCEIRRIEPTMLRKSTRSRAALAIRRDEQTPLQ